MAMGMRIAGGVMLSIIAASAAHAAPPKVAGKYGAIAYHICQTVFVAPKGTADKNNMANAQPVISSLSPLWTAGNNSAGMISIEVGTVTFPATAASSGNATVSNVEIVGHAQRFTNTGVSADNTGFMRMTNSGSGAFSITATQVTFGGKVYDFSYGNVVYGVARTVNLVRRSGDGDYCLDQVTLTKQ